MVFKRREWNAKVIERDNALDPALVRKTLMRARRLRTIDELARMLDVSRVTVYNWIEGRSIPYRKERNTFIRLCESLKLNELRDEWNSET